MMGWSVYAQKTIWSLNTNYYYDYNNPDFGITDPLDNFYTMFYFHDSASLTGYDTIYGKKKSFGIAKFDANGNEKWAVTVSADDSIYMADMVADNVGGVYFYLYSYRPKVYITRGAITKELTGSSSYLVKLDSNGNLDWYNAIETNVFYHNANRQYFYTAKLLIGENNKLYLFTQYQGKLTVGAVIHNHPINNTYEGIALLKVDSAGGIVRISNLVTDRINWRGESRVHKVQFNLDRGEIDFLITPSCYDINIIADRYNNTAKQYIISIDTQGNKNKVLPIYKEGSVNATTFERLPDRGFVVGLHNATNVKVFGVSFPNIGVGSDVILIRVSEEGVPKWRREYHGDSRKSIWDIKLSEDSKYIYTYGSLEGGDIIIEGKYIPKNHTGDYLAKYNLDGNNVWFYFTYNGSNTECSRLAVDTKGDIYICDLDHGGNDTFKFNCYIDTNQYTRAIYLKIRDGQDDLFDNISAVCINEQIELIPKDTGAGYVWSTGETTPTIKVNGPGTYYLSIDTGFCSLNGSVTVDTLDLPVVVDVGKDIDKCLNAEVELTAQTNALKYQWSNSQTTASIQVTDTGYYSVMVDSAGCVGYDTVYIGMDTLTQPIVSLGGDTGICADDSIFITAQTMSAIVNWSMGGNDASQWLTDTGTYYIEVDSLGCRGRDTLYIGRRHLKVTPISDTFYCEGSEVELSYKGNYDSLEWGNGSKLPASVVKSEGFYNLTIYYDGCKGSDTLYVYKQLLPKSKLLDTATHCFDGEPFLTLTPGTAETYQWSTGEQTQTIQVTQPGTYTVTLANKTCKAEDKIQVKNFCKFSLYAPNVFNPNSPNPENRVFKPVGSGLIIIKLSIYNRWGEMIYYQEGADAQWDGTYKGVPVMQGRYMYIVTYRAKTDSPTQFDIGTESGYLTLLR